jgi:hypothetical protein
MDKKFYQSKKFIGFVFSTLIIAGILIVGLVSQTFTMAMAIFMSTGMLGLTVNAVSYVSGQAALDRFIEAVKRPSGSSEEN